MADDLPGPSDELRPRSLSDVLRDNLRPDGDAHTWVTRNLLEPAQYAMHYPPRALGRYMDPEGRNPFWTPQLAPFLANQLHPTYSSIGARHAYQPGSRESENVEDRRPRNWWDY